MEIYQNNGTGIFTKQDRPCNTFGFFNLNVNFASQTYSVSVYLWEVEQDALDGKTPNNIRNLDFAITTEETLDDCSASVFAGSPYQLEGEILDLSNVTVIGKYP